MHSFIRAFSTALDIDGRRHASAQSARTGPTTLLPRFVILGSLPWRALIPRGVFDPHFLHCWHRAAAFNRTDLYQRNEASMRSGANSVTYCTSSATTPCWTTFRPSRDVMIPSTSCCRGQQCHGPASTLSVRSGIIESPASARRCTIHGNPLVGSLMDLSWVLTISHVKDLSVRKEIRLTFVGRRRPLDFWRHSSADVSQT
jgi:hypothetical protein